MASTNSRKRPRSRASTASIHSVTTQPNLDQGFAVDGADEYATGHWLPVDQASPKDRTTAPSQMSPEELILQAASQLQGGRDISLDAHQADGLSFTHRNNSMDSQAVGADSFIGNASYLDPDSQMQDALDDGDSMTGVSGQQKMIAKSSANNEKEMLQLFTLNKHRSLQDVAEELHGNERGPNSERTRQVFAMLWLNTVCSKGKGSVPRGRVYANYASRCATERITVLNPASFGKLVRVLFPGLKTRRLGVRGESKYHYVNFTLREDQVEEADALHHVLQIPLPEASTSMDPNLSNILPANSSVHPARSVLPTPEAVHRRESKVGRSRDFMHSLYNQPIVSNVDQLQSNMSKTAQKLYFISESEEAFQQSQPLVLPRIETLLPPGTDPDAAKSLTALYRSHCTSLVECIRYCKEKTFFHLFTSFQGTLTMPVQKLFGNPAIAPWIEECDFIMYQRMMRIVSNLTLQVVPKPVLDTLRNISERLVRHIRESFQGQPQHVVRAKEAPATIFAGLLDRALRVNLTAHAAANMLANPANRDLMYIEWITMVNPRKVAESVPSRGMDDVVTILLADIRDVLDPVNVPWELEAMTLQGDMATRRGHQPQSGQPGSTNASNVLDRWVAFLRSLPDRFPYASHTDIVWCVQRVGTAVMRDITMTQGKSFGSWWVTKCWIDEMVQFLAEQGGFMKQTSTQGGAVGAGDATRRQASSREATSGPQSSRYSSGSDGDFNNNNNNNSMSHHSRMSQSQPDRAPFPSVSTPAAQPPNSNTRDVLIGVGDGGLASHDDSGIGIRTPDEDLPLEKFAAFAPDAQDILELRDAVISPVL